MKNQLCLCLLLGWSLSLYAQGREENLILNPNFDTIVYDFLSKIKRMDVPHAKPLHWQARSKALMPIFQLADPSPCNCMPSVQQRWNLAKERKTVDSMFTLMLVTGTQKEFGLFSRDYVFASLSRPLAPGELCRLEAKVYLDDVACLGLPGLGFQLYDRLPQDFDLLTPLIDPKAMLLPFPNTNEHGRWVDLSYTFKAKGGEQILGLGCFLPEKALKLYRLKGRRKVPCKLKGGGHQALILGQVRLWVEQQQKIN